MSIPFSKYSGCGNDFIIIDNRTLNISPSQNAIQHLCHRQYGIGADGLIFLEKSKVENADHEMYLMRIFNNDGIEAEMCGNGVRCLAQYIRSTDPNCKNYFIIETMLQQMEVFFDQELVKIRMPMPKSISSKKITVSQQELPLHYLDTGVPHAVYFVHDIENEEFNRLAPSIRSHKEFQPRGTNVNFAQILADQSVAIRTYERGVERETLACGTGAVAVALASADTFGIQAPIKIRTRSGDNIDINFHGDWPNLTNLTMKGPAIKTFEGSFEGKIFGLQFKLSPFLTKNCF
jgi:diaminopimelate epimerase